ncbi:MAG: TetR/AcrR family transcriptional regulator [Candidatus Abyssobacteria bacterium SURF_17]|jgi:AcrR family transcriptional regulator|uniref:TetR/AcrR family transcriptional regulator n=1 Tax=Candidatus Abyssobacteria bacterium SURF_17 TaxID=2093361 RepID=A0A419F093_9BACT|nr:MAG: TetR/AcrR family transcriptional regulator [Candidatus Abyssubacteria bacterium SURF_17]
MSPKVGVEPIRQAQIIEAALLLIARHGSHSVSIQSVATKAGLSKGAVLHYYPTKEALFAAVFQEFFHRIFEQSKEIMARHDDPLEKIRSFGDWLFDETTPVAKIGYPLYLECMSRAAHEELFHQLFHEWVNNWVELLRGAIEEGIRKGVFSNVNPEETARALSAVCQGIASRWYLNREGHPAQWARETLRTYAEGVLKRG